MNNEQSIVKHEPPPSFSPALEHLAENIAKSTIIPQEFRGNMANCLIALEMAHRVGAGVLQIMQSMYIVHNRPSWSGQFIIGAVNSTQRFKTALKFQFNDDKTACYAWAEDRDGNEVIGPTVSIEMAKKEGWWDRNPKWKNLTELMLMYRAGTFFGRVYCPDILMGMREQYEVIEAEAVEIREPQIPTQTKDMVHEATVGDGGEEGLVPAVSPPPEPKPPTPPKKTASKKKLQVKPPPPKETPLIKPAAKAQPNRDALNERLKVGGFTEAQFVALCNEQEWLGKGKKWDSIDHLNNDDMLAVFLSEEEWPVVAEQLEATVTRI